MKTLLSPAQSKPISTSPPNTGNWWRQLMASSGQPCTKMINGASARPALIAMFGMAVYVSANIGISRYVGWKAGMSEPYPEIAVTNALPLTFWKREVLWRSGESYGRYTVTFPFSKAQMEPARSHNMHDPRIAKWSASNPAARAFLFWSRMPIASPDGGAINLRDQRFTDSFGRSNFSVMLTPPEAPQSAR